MQWLIPANGHHMFSLILIEMLSKAAHCVSISYHSINSESILRRTIVYQNGTESDANLFNNRTFCYLLSCCWFVYLDFSTFGCGVSIGVEIAMKYVYKGWQIITNQLKITWSNLKMFKVPKNDWYCWKNIINILLKYMLLLSCQSFLQ